MRWWHTFGLRVRSLVRRKQVEDELDEELRFHLDQQIAENVRAGMSSRDARASALRELGSVTLIKDQSRDELGLRLIDQLRQDGRYAFRALLKTPSFSVVAVLMLGLGMGLNAAVFSVTNTVLFRGFPLVEGNDRLLYLSAEPGCCVSYPDFEDWRAQARTFQGMAIVHGIPKTFSDGSGSPETINTTEISAETFALTGQRPILGRDFRTSDEKSGAPAVVILRYGFWERRYGRDPAILGRSVRINGEPATVVGVMPRGFSFPQNADLWVPLVPTPEVRKRDNRGQWFVFGRLADGVTIDAARAEMTAIGRNLGTAYPLTNQGRHLVPRVQTFDEFFIGSNATVIYQAMVGAVGLVLVIACANLANLLLARGLASSREIRVRLALGAGRWRIVQQQLIESMMLASTGGVVGWWMAVAAVRVFSLTTNGPSLSDNIAGAWFDNTLDYTMDWRALLYLGAVTVATGLLFGLIPATRLSSLAIDTGLKDRARSVLGSPRARHLSNVLVVAEMALAIVLLAGAGVMVRSFLKIYRADLGFNNANMVTALFALPGGRYSRPTDQITFVDRLTAGLKASPEIGSVAVASGVPTGGSSFAAYELAGASVADEQQRPIVSTSVISAEYFATLGLAALSGREFKDADVDSSPPVALVNQLFAKTHWPAQDALGQHLRLFNGRVPGPWLTVVGVVPDVVPKDHTRQQFEPSVYLPYPQQPKPNIWVLVRTRVDNERLGHSLRRVIESIDPELPIVIGPRRMSELLAESYQYRGTTGALFLSCAAIALVLASVGLYAVVAYSVSQRTQEIGVRIAIGATVGDIRDLVLRQGVRPIGMGLAFGIAASLGVNRILKSQLVQVSPSDPMTLMVAAAVLVVSAAIGCWIPARRAALVDPVVALRSE
jgi:predicted permease